MNDKTAYPLCWPSGWPKTEPFMRTIPKPTWSCTLQSALAYLEKEVRLMGGTNLILSSNYTLGASNPKEPGVVAYFTWQKMQMAIPCDRWLRIEHNVQAIARTIEAMRGMERWGAKHMIRAMFTGFKQLPENTSNWWETLGVPINAPEEQVKAAYRMLSKKHHPDAGGDPDLFRRVQLAYEQYEARPVH